VFALDEYLDVPPEDPRTCAGLLEREVARAWKIPPQNYHPLSSCREEAGSSLQRHLRLLDQNGGIDVAVLGLGQNGHLGFNEPGSSPDSQGGIVELEASSIEANREWFSGDYAPRRGVTLGLARLLSSRHVLLIAYGCAKAIAVNRMRTASPNVHSPASWLQQHPDVRVFLDREAAG
jgi:glucosamine-6-phosphate deaminase